MGHGSSKVYTGSLIIVAEKLSPSRDLEYGWGTHFGEEERSARTIRQSGYPQGVTAD